MIVQLVPLGGGESIELTKPINLVGRKEGCDVRLNHKSVSKQHCILVHAEGMLMLRDLGSTNGTRVNGKRIRRAALVENDQFSIAAMTFRVKFGQTPAPAPVHMNDVTQHIDASEVDMMIRKTKPHDSIDQPGEAVPAVKVNTLPDEFTVVHADDDPDDKG